MTISSSKQQSAPAQAINFRYCPRCGHTLYQDTTVEKRFGVEVMLCPVDRIRFTYIVATETLHVVKI